MARVWKLEIEQSGPQTHVKVDDVGSNEHSNTLYKVSQYMNEGCAHIDIIVTLLVVWIWWGSWGMAVSPPTMTVAMTMWPLPYVKYHT